MKSTDLFPINGPWLGRLTISARPRGADWLAEEMRGWRDAGIDTVVSLLTPRETAELELENEAQECRGAGMEFLSFPIEDRSIPASFSEVSAFVAPLSAKLQLGQRINVHCRQGIGRAPLIAVAILMEQGQSSEDAMQAVASGRGLPIPETVDQKVWIGQFAQAAHQPQ